MDVKHCIKGLKFCLVGGAVISGMMCKTPDSFSRIDKAPRNLETKLQAEQGAGLIVLDPGHGYDNCTKGLMDPGAVYGDHKESEIVLGQAKKIKLILEKRGYEVILTREDDKKSVPLGSRLPIAKESNADLFVSLHCNAYSSPSANGIETYYKGGQENEKLAKMINDSLVNKVKLNYNEVTNRGVKKENWRVLDNDFPSVLVESGFITNKRDREYLTDDIPDVESGIAEGIVKYMESLSD